MPAALKTFLLLVLAALPCLAQTNAQNPVLLDRWFAAQAQVKTWNADFTQTRSLKALVQPLTTKGHVWFAAPGSFRWELGQPPQTIAVRATDGLLVIYPPTKRAEKYPPASAATGQWRDMASLIEAGFPRSRAELDKQFLIARQNLTNDTCELTLQPKSATARKMMPEFRLAFSANTLDLLATEMRFADGSVMRNDFTNAQLNAQVSAEMFAPKLDDSYKVIEPLKPK